MKYKILLFMFVIALFVFSVGIAYSGFTSNSLLNTVDQKIAKFVFDTETLDRLELPLISMVPGQSEEYNFSISNSSDNIKLHSYTYIIKSYICFR